MGNWYRENMIPISTTPRNLGKITHLKDKSQLYKNRKKKFSQKKIVFHMGGKEDGE